MPTMVTEQTTDFVAYAKRHRYRLRTLHDRNPQAPPAVCMLVCAAGQRTGSQEIVQK